MPKRSNRNHRCLHTAKPSPARLVESPGSFRYLNYLITVQLSSFAAELAQAHASVPDALPGAAFCALADGLLASLNIDLYLFQRHELGFSEARITAAACRLLAGLQRP